MCWIRLQASANASASAIAPNRTTHAARVSFSGVLCRGQLRFDAVAVVYSVNGAASRRIDETPCSPGPDPGKIAKVQVDVCQY